MYLLIGFAAGLSVILAFSLGVVLGARFGCPPAKQKDSLLPDDVDPVRQLRIEEERKAFADCMSYSAERAYERNQP